ncbi:MAG: replicative DNA helicase [Actinomycetota bacterium]|nr:replicative DNA helicase [Actinomycetota bacterium]
MVQSISEVRQRSGGGRIPPHNLEAEESLLGAMMLSKDAIAAALEAPVRSEDFYKPAHGHLFEAIQSLYTAAQPVDPVTVAEELRRADLLDAVGGKGAILRIQAGTPAAANAAHYARIVEEHALLRRLIGVASEISEMGYEMPDDVTVTLDRAETLVFDVANRRISTSLTPLYEAIQESLDQLERLFESDGAEITGVPTGFYDLDDMLLGLQPSALIVVAARPGQGKTSFALGVSSHVALETRRPVLFFSMEMGYLELTQRILGSEAGVNARLLRTGKIRESDWTKVSHAVGRLAEAPFYIDDNPHLTVMDMRARTRRLKALHGDLGLVVVDYLQLMSSNRRAENRQVEVSELSRGLKILARDLETPVVALSQLNRSLEYRQDKRPMLADLRESGCLTADTRLLRADTGAEVTLGELVVTGARDVPVWSLDDRWRLVPATLTHAFPSGTRPVYRLRLASGRELKATANHPFRTLSGWEPLGRLGIGDRLAVPRAIPSAHGFTPATHGNCAPETTPTVVPGAQFRISTHRAPVATLNLDLGTSDVAWDAIVEISALGEEPVFDATVLGTHNFVANGVVAHNSIEQDADVVCFIYRDESYNPESTDKGTAEIIVAKHRNGPTGKVKLAFNEDLTRFDSLTRN